VFLNHSKIGQKLTAPPISVPSGGVFVLIVLMVGLTSGVKGVLVRSGPGVFSSPEYFMLFEVCFAVRISDLSKIW